MTVFERIDARAARSQLPPPGERRRLRIAHGMTLQDMADLVTVVASRDDADDDIQPVSRQAVSHWECGRRAPRDRTARAYLDLLSVLAAAAGEQQ